MRVRRHAANPADSSESSSSGSPARAGNRQTDLFGSMAVDPARLTRERETLADLASRGVLRRWSGYSAFTGPGWLQSALTLGSGSAIASLYLGAHYGYELLWVQPIAMLTGIVMLGAAARQTLCTGVRPFDAMRRFVHPAAAWAWGLATLVASFVFHLPQYALAAGVTEDLVHATTGWQAQGTPRTLFLLAIGTVILALSTVITWSYGRGLRGVRLYERMLKLLVWIIILAFAAVVARAALAGRVDWEALVKGLLPLSLPSDSAGVTKVMGAFGAAVGINMTFLFGYSLLARGWSREHLGLARFDLVTGMLIPYALATSLMVVAAACTLHGTGRVGRIIDPAAVGVMIGEAGVGPFAGRILFGLGVLGMALSTITLQMLVSGLALCEMLGIPATGWRYRMACLLPAPAFVGVVLWKTLGTWIALPAFAFGLFMLPIAYVGWFILNNSTRFLGADRPRGRSAIAWNLALASALGITCAGVGYSLATRFLLH